MQKFKRKATRHKKEEGSVEPHEDGGFQTKQEVNVYLHAEVFIEHVCWKVSTRVHLLLSVFAGRSEKEYCGQSKEAYRKFWFNIRFKRGLF